tara:strand:- start:702 stop:878 length:177 start_codon:yes stop_codon:yes gene_type:complete
MARNWYGNKSVTKEDLYTKKTITHSEVQSEYWKIVLWVLGGYLYFHFVIMGWGYKNGF